MKGKILLFLGAALMLASCESVKKSFSNSCYITDYSVAAKAGFFITESNTVPFDYEPIGSVVFIQESGWEKKKKQKSDSSSVEGFDDVYGDHRPSYMRKEQEKSGDYRYASTESAITELMNDAFSLNADGILNFKQEVEFDLSQKPNKIIISGMLFKRK